mmetsp:Transcript_15292/g.15868  ORF Transcript_15292/g.15868 Transcript_15292/m.15868 type:complete len:641 (+) Transcript_15292:23-1945(+)
MVETVNEKLLKLREIMKQKGFDALIVPHSDPHDNEYLASPDERLSFITNFGGSNGLALVTQQEALCWTDGRYYISCEKQLYSGWKMKKMERGEKNSRQYIKETLPLKSKVAVDFSQISNETYKAWKAQLEGFELVNDESNSIDEVWGKDKPSYKKDPVTVHELEFTGETCQQKFQRVVQTYLEKSAFPEKKNASMTKLAFLIVKLDDIAWISNLRGQDIEFNPVFFSYAILYYDSLTKEFNLHLFADIEKFSSDKIQLHLKENNISLYKYTDIFPRLKGFADDETVKAKFSEYLLIADEGSINQNVYSVISSQSAYKYFIDSVNLVEFTKYVKNETEIKGMKDCHVRDGAALVRYFAWLERELLVNKATVNEYQAAQKSIEFRKQGKYFVGESFECISSTGANAAIIHYKPEAEDCSVIDKDKVYLCDSGAQYFDGTTDTTRTLYFNTETAKNLQKEKEMYTRVLLGNLAIERSVFKKRWNLSGSSVDAIARHSLWHAKEDYNHGTGHGVGHYLNVHEGPNGIGGYPGNPSFSKGMVMSNEPGYYLKDHFGIRIENVITVDEDENKDLLKFVNMTMVPYELNLLDFNLLSNDYIDYLNAFHEEVKFKLLPLLEEYQDYVAIEYLKRKAAPIQRFSLGGSI